MIKNRRAFSFFEVILVIVIFGLLAAIFVPATVKIREDVCQSMIEKQLNAVIKAAQQYNADKGTSSVDYKTLVDSKYIPKLESVSGESYDALTIASRGTASVKTSMGKDISVEY